MKQNKHLLGMLRTATAASALVLAFGAALAQGPIQGPVQGGPGTPRVDQPSQSGGGGVGIGINIDLGSVFNAIRNATRKDTQDKDDQTKPPVLQKKAVTVSSGSSGNYTIDWVVQYANNTGATLPSVTVKDGPIATIINPSLVPGLVPQQGWTGTTNGNVPVDNYALFSGTNIAPHGVMTATFIASGSSGPVTLSGGGDGFQPIPYAHSAGRRIYIMNHHEGPGSNLFDCVIAATGVRCKDFPRTLPFGDGSTKSSGTTGNNAEYVIDGSKFYYPAQNFAEWGIGCYDLELDSQCGYVQLGAGSSLATKTTLQGPWRVANELYFADYDGRLYCATLAAGLPACLSSGYKIPLIDIKINTPSRSGQAEAAILNWRNGLVAAKVVGTRIYITSRTIWVANHAASVKSTNCFDTVTKTACWSSNNPTKGSAANAADDPYLINYSNFIYYSNTGTALAICTKYEVAPYQGCTSLATGLATTLPRIFTNHAYRTTLDVHVWPRTYFTGVGAANGAGWCWDWSTGNYCSGINGSFSKPTGTTGEYGNNIDDRGCIWTYGHEHHLWSYDPNRLDPITKQALACGGDAGKATQTFQPLQYCSGTKPFHWTSVEVKGAALANYDKFIVKVLDSSNNTVLFTKDLKAAGQLLTSITGIDAQTLSKPLKIEVEYTPKPGMGATDKPYLEARYNAPPIEFCFKSTHSCQQTKITNIVETPDPVKQGSYISVKVDVDKPQDCTIPPPPVCGQPGQPPCPTCGTVTTPACPVCGQPGQPPCEAPKCDQPGQPRCRVPLCGAPGMPICPCASDSLGCISIWTGGGCKPGDPLCSIGRPPLPKPICLTGDCPDKPAQSVSEEYKPPKVACVRKEKPAEDPKKAAAPKPRPKPAVTAAAPPVPVDPNAPPKPKPKPRPKSTAKPAAAADDC